MESSSEDEMINNVEENERDEESSDEESNGEDEKLSEPSKTAKYNRDGLNEKLEDIQWPENAGWIHALSVDVDQGHQVDVNDDLARELSFYTQALEGTRNAFEKLESIGIPFLRPADYYAEMVKSDAHMVKVKGRLLAEKKQIEESEERRKGREAKKMGKEVQAQRLKERSAQKKSEIETVKKWRKQREQSGYARDGKKGEEMDFNFEDGKVFERSKKRKQGVSPGDRSGGRVGQAFRKGGNKGEKPGGTKREARNSKFGYGGRKGLKKQNTADTTADFKGYSKGNNKGDARPSKRMKK